MMALRNVASSMAPVVARCLHQTAAEKQAHVMRQMVAASGSLTQPAWSKSSPWWLMQRWSPEVAGHHAMAFSSTAESGAAEQAAAATAAADATVGDAAASNGTAATEEAAAAPAEPTPEQIIADLKKQLEQSRESMLLARANEANTLRISQQDVIKAREFAVQSFAKSLLEVADNLHSASSVVPDGAIKDGPDHDLLRQVVEGVKLTEDGLMKTFNQFGITKFGVQGEPFNANVHEALFTYEDPTAVPGTLGQVVQVGYMLKGRVLRSAKAGIVKRSDAPTPKPEGQA
jgi:molecular chaperone GrpE